MKIGIFSYFLIRGPNPRVGNCRSAENNERVMLVRSASDTYLTVNDLTGPVIFHHLSTETRDFPSPLEPSRPVKFEKTFLTRPDSTRKFTQSGLSCNDLPRAIQRVSGSHGMPHETTHGTSHGNIRSMG